MTDRQILETILNKVSSLENKIDSMDSQIKENAQILKALEHNSQEHKALLDQLNMRTASVEGSVEAIKKDLSQVEMVTANNWADIARLKSVK